MGRKPDQVEPWRIKKDSEPGPGSYPIEDVIKKTQWLNKNHAQTVKEVREPFTDTIARRKKFIPGMGHYKNDFQGYDKRCSSQMVRRNPHMIEKAWEKASL